MKRKTEPVPGFDEIIFENRNKEYGAYDLRKHYKSNASISVLGGTIFCSAIVILLSLNTEKSIARYEPVINIMEMDKSITVVVPEQDTKPPEAIAQVVRNVAPEVSTDTSTVFTPPPINDDIVRNTKDREVNDTNIVFHDNPEPIFPDEPEPLISVKEMPEFPGGIPELMNYISKNLKYPDEAINNNIQGRVVLKFVVRADGSIGRTEIIAGVDTLLNTEAVRVVKGLPAFKPGRQDGTPVPVWFTIPVLFKLDNH